MVVVAPLGLLLSQVVDEVAVVVLPMVEAVRMVQAVVLAVTLLLENLAEDLEELLDLMAMLVAVLIFQVEAAEQEALETVAEMA